MMTSRKLIRDMRDAHRVDASTPVAARDRLEEDLLHELRKRRGGRGGRRTLLRPAFALPGLVVLLVGVGALPASYPVDVGSVLTLDLPRAAGPPPAIGELLGSLESTGAAEDVSVSVSQRAGEGAHLMLLLIGARLPDDEVVRSLRARFPALAGANVTRDALVGSVRSSLAGKLGRALSWVEVSAADVEEARARILEELDARGFHASQVDVHDADDHRAIDVELEEQD